MKDISPYSINILKGLVRPAVNAEMSFIPREAYQREESCFIAV